MAICVKSQWSVPLGLDGRLVIVGQRVNLFAVWKSLIRNYLWPIHASLHCVLVDARVCGRRYVLEPIIIKQAV